MLIAKSVFVFALLVPFFGVAMPAEAQKKKDLMLRDGGEDSTNCGIRSTDRNGAPLHLISPYGGALRVRPPVTSRAVGLNVTMSYGSGPYSGGCNAST